MKRLYAHVLLWLLRLVLDVRESVPQSDSARQAALDAAMSDRLPWRIENGRIWIDHPQSERDSIAVTFEGSSPQTAVQSVFLGVSRVRAADWGRAACGEHAS